MTHSRIRAVSALAATAVIVLAACGSSSKSSSSTTTSAAAATSTSVAATSTSAAASPFTVTISPDTGLSDGQKVAVKGTGFTKAGETLGLTECADKGAQTGAGDCDLHNIVTTTADSSGNVSTSFVVHKGPFGSNNIVCSASQKCLVSVATAGSASPDQVGAANITFS
jgi:hypothetical protein